MRVTQRFTVWAVCALLVSSLCNVVVAQDETTSTSTAAVTTTTKAATTTKKASSVKETIIVSPQSFNRLIRAQLVEFGGVDEAAMNQDPGRQVTNLKITASDFENLEFRSGKFPLELALRGLRLEFEFDYSIQQRAFLGTYRDSGSGQTFASGDLLLGFDESMGECDASEMDFQMVLNSKSALKNVISNAAVENMHDEITQQLQDALCGEIRKKVNEASAVPQAPAPWFDTQMFENTVQTRVQNIGAFMLAVAGHFKTRFEHHSGNFTAFTPLVKPIGGAIGSIVGYFEQLTNCTAEYWAEELEFGEVRDLFDPLVRLWHASREWINKVRGEGIADKPLAATERDLTLYTKQSVERMGSFVLYTAKDLIVYDLQKMFNSLSKAQEKALTNSIGPLLATTVEMLTQLDMIEFLEERLAGNNTDSGIGYFLKRMQQGLRSQSAQTNSATRRTLVGML